MKPVIARRLAWTLLIICLGVAGSLLLFTRFMIYDDEGYVLWSVRGFCEGSPLYTEVYSQYGPLFFLFYRTLHAMTGVVFDNDTARLLNLGYWLGAAILAGVVAQGLARRLAAGLVATALTFLTLVNNVNEPFHPGALLALLVAVAGALGARLIGTDREQHLGWAVTLLATAACLIKINVGAFLFAALGSWLGLDSRGSPALRRLALGAITGGVVAAPLVLMREHMGQAQIQQSALVFICGGLALLIERRQDRLGLFKITDWARAAGAGLALGGAIVAGIHLLGTQIADLLDGILLGPLRHPGVYTFPPDFPIFAVLLAPISLLGAHRLTQNAATERSQRILALAKLGAGAALFAQCATALDQTPLDRFAYYFGPALVWILSAPLGEEPQSTTRRARWIGWIFIWQTLQAFPVAGSQVAWGSFWVVPLLVYAWFQASDYLARTRLAPRLIAAGVAGIGTTLALALCLRYGFRCLRDSAPLDLPGARWIRPPPESTATIRVITRNLQLHARTVFSLPGMCSLNIWSEKPTPTQANATHWFSLLNEAQQAEIAERLDADPTALVVLQRDLLRFLLENGYRPAGLLHDHLLTHFVPLARIDGYDLWGHPGRQLDFVDTFAAAPGGLVSISPPLPRPPCSALLITPGLPTFQLNLSSPTRASVTPGLEKHFFSLPSLQAKHLPASARLVLLDKDERELARLRPNLIPITAAAPPAAD